jgi:5-methylcytosine-specific restriction endonuclease McrA
MNKICSKCNRELPVGAFYKKKSGKFGLSNICKQCDKERLIAYRLTDQYKEWVENWLKKQQELLLVSTTKVCSRCSRELPLAEFHGKNRGKLGVEVFCKQCKNKAGHDYRHSEEGKAAIKELNKTDLYKATKKKYSQSPKGKLTKRKNNRTENGKAKFARARHKRRAAMAILSTLTAEEWKNIKDQYKHKCVYCGKTKPLTMEHLIPLSRGGHHVKENIVPACLSCNSTRGNKPMLLEILAMAVPLDKNK